MKIAKIIALAGTLAVSALSVSNANAWWGGGPWNGFGNGAGNGDFSFNMSGRANTAMNGYGYNAPRYGYAPYGYAPYGGAPYGYAPYGAAPYGAAPVAPQAPAATTQK